MLDIELQNRLDRATSLHSKDKLHLTKWQFGALFVAISLFSATLGISVFANLTTPSSLPPDQLGKLAVLVSAKTHAVPSDIWIAMERHVGKQASKFDANDQMEAIEFLLQLVDQHPKQVINIW